MKHIFKIILLLGILNTSMANDTQPLDTDFLCGDILTNFADKPEELEFVKCEIIQNGQTVVRAQYKVSGKESNKVEDFFVKKYGMGKLKWTCCGWETPGIYGQFTNKELTNIHPHLVGLITMSGTGEVTNQTQTDRSKIDFFTVTVELAII